LVRYDAQINQIVSDLDVHGNLYKEGVNVSDVQFPGQADYEASDYSPQSRELAAAQASQQQAAKSARLNSYLGSAVVGLFIFALYTKWRALV
jgi:hypothetical protein